MNKGKKIAALLAIGIGITGADLSFQESLRRKPKNCLYCGMIHFHNNSFCCAEHCKAYREAKK